MRRTPKWAAISAPCVPLPAPGGPIIRIRICRLLAPAPSRRPRRRQRHRLRPAHPRPVRRAGPLGAALRDLRMFPTLAVPRLAVAVADQIGPHSGQRSSAPPGTGTTPRTLARPDLELHLGE